MNTPPDTSLHLDSRSFEPPVSDPRPMYWSVRRELWENRFLYVAPLMVAALVLFGSFVATLSASGRMRTNATQASAKHQTSVIKPFSMAPAPIMLTTFLIGFFYCLDALYGERRDRSILFWKSLPVSDLTTVLSKASIPLMVLPVIAFVISAVTQLLLLPVTMAVSIANGTSAALFRTVLPEPIVMIYGLTVHVLWFAPIYAWLLLVSAWARRTPLLWAILPLLIVSALERIVFNTTYFMYMLQYRLTGAMKEAFSMRGGAESPIMTVSQLNALNFLSTPGLWVGLIFAAFCLAAAVRLRRNREPI